MIRALGYVGFGTTKLDEWADFATRLLGMQVAGRTASSLALRMDGRSQRIFLDSELPQDCAVLGWEVADEAALAALEGRLRQAGLAVEKPSAVARKVAGLIAFRDPAGHRHEIFHGAAEDPAPFQPGRNISGFRTGALGVGHLLLTAERIGDLLPFYREILGCGLSDYMRQPFHAHFLHVNGRHHSVALIEAGKTGIHHLMVELLSFDDVGQGYDLALSEPERVAVTLGRHANDFITSFYVRTPSDFFVEYGWGGRHIDPATWQPVECAEGPSLWGHERSWLPAEQRKVALDMRLNAAVAGLRQPVQVVRGGYREVPS